MLNVELDVVDVGWNGARNIFHGSHMHSLTRLLTRSLRLSSSIAILAVDSDCNWWDGIGRRILPTPTPTH